jgi:hypothetical protein
LISKLVELVTDVVLATLLGVLVLPVSANSTVMGVKFWEGGVMAAVMLLEVRVSVAAPVVVNGEQLVPIPPRPAGKDAAPVLTHHS